MSYAFRSFGIVGVLPFTLPGLDMGTEVVQGLTWIKGTSSSPLDPPKNNPSQVGVAYPVQIIGTSTTFYPSKTDMTTTDKGQATIAIPSHPNENWVINSALLGNAVLVRQSQSSNAPALDVVVTKSPQFVAANASPLLGGTYALIASDSAVLTAAIPLAVKPYGGGCQAGYTPSADGKSCVPAGGGAQQASMPSWALPVGVAAAAALLAFAVFSRKRKGATIHANWR